ncbi:MAG: ABC transporter permease [Rhodothermales bacterium]
MRLPEPPRHARALLRRFCAPYWREELEGDLAEQFEADVLAFGERVARRRYWVQVFRFIRPYIIRRREARRPTAWGGYMFKNYLTIALRTFRKHASYTAINVTGLAVGMACCVLIFLLVRHEWTYDTFHANADRIYRTYAPYTDPGGDVQIQAMMTPDFTSNLSAAFPQIEAATRYVERPQDLEVGDQAYQQRLMEADSSFFHIFTFPFLAGSPETALVDPNEMILSARAVDAMFPDAQGYADVLGRTVSITRGENTYDFAVAGVIENIPINSSLVFDAAISFENYGRIRIGGNNWGGRTSTYVLLPEGQSAEALEASFPPFVATEFGEYISGLRDAALLAEGEDALQLRLQPLRELHLDTQVWLPYEVQAHNPQYSYILGGIGLLVLLIACINFMTLSVGRSASRAREVGLRKVLGAARPQIMRQFWGEALVLSALALVLGGVLAAMALPLFNDLTGQQLSLTVLSGTEVVLGLLALLLVVGVVAGGYPAAVLSGYQPAAVFKGGVQTRGNSLLTRVLVVAQYTISIGLIIATLVMGQQLNFLMDKDLGFDKEGVLVVHTGQVNQNEAPAVVERFREQLLQHPGIVDIAKTGYAFTRGSDRNGWEGRGGQRMQAYNNRVDYNYLDVLGMELAEGRNFSEEFASDPTTAVLVNEAFVREHGIEDPVGQPMTGWLTWVFEEPPTIIGVVKDFNFRSLHEEVSPQVMNMHPDYYTGINAMLIRVRPEAVSTSVRQVEQAWAEILPGKPLNYSFLDEDMNAQYQAEQRWSRIVQLASLFAVFIACLGLFGLATLTVTKRTKEIGVRKVLGASVSGIVGLIGREFAKLVVIASVLAWPIAYYGLAEWLGGFAYRIGLTPWAFLGAGVAALVIALLTISLQTIRAATANPVESLRYE